MKKLQFVNWFPCWKGIIFKRTDPKIDKNAGYYLIYKWFIVLGFWEIRCLMNAKERKKAIGIHVERRFGKVYN